jgi:hypothetical protein
LASVKEKYGKLTQSEIEAVLQLLPKLEKERQELQALIEKKPEKFAERFLATGFAWSHLYEVPFLQLLRTFLAVAGVDQVVAHASRQVAPVEALLNLTDTIQDMEWAGGGNFTPGDLLGYLHAIVGNLDCLVIYGSYLNDLIAEAKTGDLEALLKTIRIDPSAVTGPTARNFLCVSVITGDKDFVNKIRKAMAGKTGKQAAYLKKFRFLMQLLHEVGALGLPTKELSGLVFNLGAYDRSASAEKNVSELILKAKAMKKNTISK